MNVLRGEDFPLKSSSNVSFTYVVVELQPFSQKYEAKAQTRYARNSISPLFNDTIHYQIPIEELQGQTLLLCVYEINHLSAHDLIGSARVNIDGDFLATGAERIYKENLKFEEDVSSEHRQSTYNINSHLFTCMKLKLCGILSIIFLDF